MRMSEEEFAAYQSRRKALAETAIKHGLPGPKPSPAPSRRAAPNKTEAEYGRMLALEYPGASIVFEGLTFKLANGHKYTPDWVVNVGDGQVICVEVKARGKNGYRLPSYQRARIMFDQCRVEWPNYCWRWAEKSGGTWKAEK